MPRVWRHKLRQNLKSQVYSVTLLVDVKKPRVGNNSGLNQRLCSSTEQPGEQPSSLGRFSLALDEVVIRAELFQLSSLEGCVLDTHDMFKGLEGRNGLSARYLGTRRELIKQQRFWETDVSRKWTFCITGQRFGSNSQVKRKTLKEKKLSNTNLLASRHIKERRPHFRLTCVAQKRLCLSSLNLVPRALFPGFGPPKPGKSALRTRLKFPFKIRRRPRRRERQNGNRFSGQNNNFARASRFFVHFVAVTARLRRENS